MRLPRLRLIYKMYKIDRKERRAMRAKMEALTDETLIDRMYQDGWLERNYGHAASEPVGYLHNGKIIIIRPGTI